MQYEDVVLKDEARNVCVDFDGVVHNNDKGFGDGTCYGEPIEGSLEAIKQLAQQYDVIIFTAKAKTDRPLVGGKTGKQLVWEWLHKHSIASYVKEVTSDKPRALVYIDDKAIRFINWNDTLTQFSRLHESK